jgi:hypothetical protein
LPKKAFDEGCDSDGQLGPFFDAVADECPFDDYDEETPELAIAPPASVTEVQNEEVYMLLSESEITSMSVKDLRNELKKWKQPVIAQKIEAKWNLLELDTANPIQDQTMYQVSLHQQHMQLEAQLIQ